MPSREPQSTSREKATDAHASQVIAGTSAAWKLPLAVRAGITFLGALLVFLALQLTVKPLTGASADLTEGVLSNLVMLGASLLCGLRAVARREERLGWSLIAVALLFSTIGDVYYAVAFFGIEEVPFPSPADAAYLAFYPLAYVGLVSVLRARLPRLDPMLKADGLVGALAFAALAGAIVFKAVVTSTEGSPATVAVNLAYPIGDLVLLSLLVGTFAGTGRGSVRAWAWLAAGLAVTALADAVYLYAAARWGYVNGAVLDALWPAGSLVIAAAAWRAPIRVPELPREGW